MIASAIRLGSIDEDFYVHAVDLARLLKTNEVEISRLVRSSVLTRVPDPNKGKAFLYPCLENVARFVEFHRVLLPSNSLQPFSNACSSACNTAFS
jgi:hypothetical protein